MHMKQSLVETHIRCNRIWYIMDGNVGGYGYGMLYITCAVRCGTEGRGSLN